LHGSGGSGDQDSFSVPFVQQADKVRRTGLLGGRAHLLPQLPGQCTGHQGFGGEAVFACQLCLVQAQGCSEASWEEGGAQAAGETVSSLAGV